jgi:hypothetical protein
VLLRHLCSAALLNFPDEEDTPEAAAAAEIVVAKLRAQGWRPHAEGRAAPNYQGLPGAALAAAAAAAIAAAQQGDAGPHLPRTTSSNAGSGARKRPPKQRQQQAGSASTADTTAAEAEATEDDEQQQQQSGSVDVNPSSSMSFDVPEWWPGSEDSDPDWYSDVDGGDYADWGDWLTGPQQQQQQTQQQQQQLVKVDSFFFDPFKHSRSDLALAASQAMRLAEEVAAACEGVASAAGLINSE